MAKTEAAQGFGFRPSASVHHFVVTLGVKDEQVIISEHFDWEEHEEKRKLSLAIGKEGQNARLAAKLTGAKIDIQPDSVLEE